MTSSLTLAISTLLDPAGLSEAVGAPRAAARLRIKPGVSVAASLTDPSGEPVGWARILWPHARIKADKTARKARQAGLDTHMRDLGEGLCLQWGAIPSDPDLMAPMQRAQASGMIDPSRWQILRHNPLRRLVARSGGGIVRIHARPSERSYALDTFLGAHIRVPARLDDGTDPHVALLADAGGCDLSAPQGTAQQVLAWHAEAGAAFARLHAVRAPAELAEHLIAPTPSTRDTLQVHARIIGALNEDLGARLEALASVVAEPVQGRCALIHGDTSPDQVLIDEAGALTLTDFDRARLASPALDVASYAVSTDPSLAQAFERGYVDAGGAPIGEEERIAASTHARALRLAEPLRQARPDWDKRVERALTRMEEETSCH